MYCTYNGIYWRVRIIFIPRVISMPSVSYQTDTILLEAISAVYFCRKQQNLITFSFKTPQFFSHFNQIGNSSIRIFIEVSRINFRGNISNGSCTDTCGQADRRMVVTKLIGSFQGVLNVRKLKVAGEVLGS
jgi:hypothetical protein